MRRRMSPSSGGGGLAWDDLRILLAVLETRSLSRAAEELGTTQPTVGRRLDALEEAMGELLVERGPHGSAPTILGAAMLPALQAMRRAAEGAEQVRSSAQRSLAGRVRVACGEAVARIVAARAASLLEGAPGLELEMVSGLDFVNLERGDADLAVRNRAPTQESLRARRLRRESFTIYASPGFLRAHPEASGPERYERCPWVGFDGPSAHAASQRWLYERLPKPPRLRLSNTSLIIEAVAAGAGLAILGASVGDADPRLVRVGPPIDELAFDVFLVSHVRTRRVPRVRYVAEVLAALLTEEGRGPERAGRARSRGGFRT